MRCTTRRTIKKRSKQAAAILAKHYAGQTSPIFLSRRNDNHHGFVIRCTHGAGDPSLVKGRPHCDCTYSPLKGTPMTGEVSGYYEPEWDERTAWEELRRQIEWATDRPPTMTAAEWEHAQRVAGIRPVTWAELQRMFSDDDEAEAA